MDSSKNINENLKYARHNDNLKLNDLFTAFRSLIKENGRIYMVYRANYLPLIIDEATKVGLKVRDIKFIYDKNKEDAKTCLFEFRVGNNAFCHISESEIIEH